MDLGEAAVYKPGQDFDISLVPALTEDEKNEAITIALNKAWEAKTTAAYSKWYWNKTNYIPKIPRYNSTEMLGVIKQEAFNQGKELVIDDDNRDILLQLAKYFTGEYGPGLNPTKGILLLGPVGCGKTFLLNLFRFNQVRSFQTRHINTIVDEYNNTENGGANAIRRYCGFMKPMRPNPYQQQEFDLFIDDVGTENEGKHFGNKENVYEKIILAVHDTWNIGRKLHVAANLSEEQMLKDYGQRVVSRTYEMFNVLTFNPAAKDRRRS